MENKKNEQFNSLVRQLDDEFKEYIGDKENEMPSLENVFLIRRKENGDVTAEIAKDIMKKLPVEIQKKVQLGFDKMKE